MDPKEITHVIFFFRYRTAVSDFNDSQVVRASAAKETLEIFQKDSQYENILACPVVGFYRCHFAEEDKALKTLLQELAKPREMKPNGGK